MANTSISAPRRSPVSSTKNVSKPSSENPLGPHQLEESYFSSTDNFLLQQLYSNVILQQQALDLSGIDPGLATKIDAYKYRMNKHALFFLNQLFPAFISLVSDASNFSALMDPILSEDRPLLLKAYGNKTIAQQVSATITASSNEAFSIAVDAKTLSTNYSLTEKSLDSYAIAYNDALNDAIKKLGVAVQKINSNIDELNTAIQQNIEDIVTGGEELGTSITDLGIGILTTITGEAEEPEKKGDKKPDKNEDKDPKTNKNKAPDVEFAVQSIKLASSGVGKATEAMKALEANNKSLAAAYQQMAQENTLIAIAKVIQAQNQLFVDMFKTSGTSIHELYIDWSAVSTAQEQVSATVSNLKSQIEANNIAVDAQRANIIWGAFAGQIDLLKNEIIGNN